MTGHHTSPNADVRTLDTPGVPDAPGRLVYWYLSFRCNLSCRHCWISASPRRRDPELDTRDALSVIESLKARQVKRLNLTGGEPLLRRDFLTILDAVQVAGLRYGIETNGTLIDDGFLSLARRGVERGLGGVVNMSLDGAEAGSHEALRGPGTFDRAVAGLEACLESGIPCEVQFVINRLNLESLSRLGEFAGRHAVRVLKLVFVTPFGEASTNAATLCLNAAERERAFEAITHLARTWPGDLRLKVAPATIPPRFVPALLGDGAPRLARVATLRSCAFPAVGILPDGSLTICALTRSDPALSLGHVRRGDLDAVWSHPRLLELDTIYAAADLEGVCADCVFREQCRGACRAWAYERGGTFRAASPECEGLAAEGRLHPIYRLSSHREAKRRSLASGTVSAP